MYEHIEADMHNEWYVYYSMHLFVGLEYTASYIYLVTSNRLQYILERITGS